MSYTLTVVPWCRLMVRQTIIGEVRIVCFLLCNYDNNRFLPRRIVTLYIFVSLFCFCFFHRSPCTERNQMTFLVIHTQIRERKFNSFVKTLKFLYIELHKIKHFERSDYLPVFLELSDYLPVLAELSDYLPGLAELSNYLPVLAELSDYLPVLAELVRFSPSTLRTGSALNI